MNDELATSEVIFVCFETGLVGYVEHRTHYEDGDSVEVEVVNQAIKTKLENEAQEREEELIKKAA